MVATAQLVKEFKYKAIRSSGSGGQHVNKVATKVELSFAINASNVLNDKQKELLIYKLKQRLTKANVLIFQCGESRSQLKNKTLVTNRVLETIFRALQPEKQRIATKLPKSATKKRLKNKRLKSDLKLTRRKPKID